MNHKTIYVKQNILFQQNGMLNNSVQLNEEIEYKQKNSNFVGCFFVCSDNLNLNHNFSINYQSQVFNQNVQFCDKTFSNQNASCLEDCFAISKVSIVDNQPVYIAVYNDNISWTQNWCQSDNMKHDNIIRFTINSDVIVNDVMYSTFNIGYYTFDTYDKFSFFNQENIFNQKNIILIRQKFISNNYNVETEQLTKISQAQDEIQMHEKISVSTKQYFVVDNKDGVIINNNISLTNGDHEITIRKINTPMVYKINFNVISQYRRVGNIVYSYNQKEIENAKLLSNYVLTEKQVDVFDNSVIVS